MRQQSRVFHPLVIGMTLVLVPVAVLLVVLDWHQVRASIDQASWEVLPLALLLTGVSYICISYGFALVNRTFGIRMRRRDLLEVGFVSMVMSHMVPFVGGYSIRLALMQRRGVAGADKLAASLFLSYFNTLAMFSLLPLGLIYILASHPLNRGGIVVLGVAVAILIMAATIATLLVFVRSIRAWVLNGLSRAGRVLIRRNIQSQLDSFDATLTQGVAKCGADPR